MCRITQKTDIQAGAEARLLITQVGTQCLFLLTVGLDTGTVNKDHPHNSERLLSSLQVWHIFPGDLFLVYSHRLNSGGLLWLQIVSRPKRAKWATELSDSGEKNISINVF